MIGGIDIQIETITGAAALEMAVRTVVLVWPRAVFENALNGNSYEQFADIPFSETDELFVYRDADVAARWDEPTSAVPELYNSMVHFIQDEGCLTLVMDRQDAVMDSIVAAVRSVLAAAQFSTAATG